MSMLTTRIALLAERLGIPLPRIAGQAKLGLMGSVRVTHPIPLTFKPRVIDLLREREPSLTPDLVVDAMNATHVWTWLQVRDGEKKWKSPERDWLVQCSEGNVPTQDFSITLATTSWSLGCVPASDGHGLAVIGVLGPGKAHYARRLLTADFHNGTASDFDLRGMVRLIASQMLIRSQIEPRKIEKESNDDIGFVTNVRRYLEALRDHANNSTPRAQYELAGRFPVQLRIRDDDTWPRAFTRPDMLLRLPVQQSGKTRDLKFLDVSDDGEVITMDWSDDRNELLDKGELQVRPGDDGFRRMREALDAAAMGADEAHGRLLAALTRPESLGDMTRTESHGEQQVVRQLDAKQLALNTPDVALIHGPPGTGKTTVICTIIEELVKKKQRVLLVAPTHVALDNVLERVGNRPGVTPIRLGSPGNVEAQAHQFLLQNRSRDLVHRLAKNLVAAAVSTSDDDAVAAVQREWAKRIENDESIGTMLLLNANLVCATPIGIAMTPAFREVSVAFDVMIIDEASKATITDFLVPATRAKKWILVGDHRQLPPYVDLGELEAVISERVKRVDIDVPDGWVQELSSRLRQHFDKRMHPDRKQCERSWRSFIIELGKPFKIDDAVMDELSALDADSSKWREALRANDKKMDTVRATLLRLGAELLELQTLALTSVFEYLIRLPPSRAVRLNYQHRMSPKLAEFSSELVYDGDYPSAPDTKKLGLDIPSLEAPAIWIDTAYAPASRRYEQPRDQNWSGGNYTNKLEADVAKELVDTCATWAVEHWQGDPREYGRGANAPFEIGVVSFYLQQARELCDAIFPMCASGTDRWRRRWKSPAANGALIDIHISIVDRFQGREKDLVVLCTTRSNPDGRRGHVDNLNRLNVAVTRARHKRIIIGDSTTLAGQEDGRRRSPGDLLVRLYETSEQKKKWGRALTWGGRHE